MATDKPIPLRATARPVTDDRPAEIIPIYPNHIPDPYPERSVIDTGVRQRTELGPLPSWTSESTSHIAQPLRFAASVSLRSRPVRRRPIPWASMSLYAIGQVALAVAIAFGSIGPTAGIAVSLLWLLCGLLLIAAQMVSQTERSQ